MKFVKYNKFKNYLESNGYVLDNGMNIYPNCGYCTILFSNINKKEKYAINVFLTNNGEIGDNVMSIAKGYGSPYFGWNFIKIDMRRMFWKNFI